MPPPQSHRMSGNHFLFCLAHRRVHYYTVALLFSSSLTIILCCYLTVLSVPIDRDAMNTSTYLPCCLGALVCVEFLYQEM